MQSPSGSSAIARRFAGWLCSAIAACNSDLPSDLGGLACSSDGQCVDGFVCTAERVCVRQEQIAAGASAPVEAAAAPAPIVEAPPPPPPSAAMPPADSQAGSGGGSAGRAAAGAGGSVAVGKQAAAGTGGVGGAAGAAPTGADEDAALSMLLLQHGLTREEFAAILGVDVQDLGSLELLAALPIVGPLLQSLLDAGITFDELTQVGLNIAPPEDDED